MLLKRLTKDQQDYLETSLESYFLDLSRSLGVKFNIKTSFLGNDNATIDSFLEISENLSLDQVFMDLDIAGIDHPTDYVEFSKWVFKNLRDKHENICKAIAFHILDNPTRETARVFRKVQSLKVSNFFSQYVVGKPAESLEQVNLGPGEMR